MMLAITLLDSWPQVLLSMLIVLLVVFLWLQWKTGMRLKSELLLLEKMGKHNVEYEFVLGTMKLSIWHFDVKTGTFTFEHDFREKGNKYYTNVDGMSMGESVSALDPRDSERVGQSLADLCSGRSSAYHEIYRVTVPYDKSVYWEESYATIVDRDSEGKPTKIVGTSQRIDERKELMASLVAARNKAEESDRLKTAFLANMGHEIRTPLNAIVGFADLLPVVQTEEERSQLITEIQNNNQKLLHIIDGLVSMSKIEAGAKSLLMARVDLNQLLQQMVDTYQPTTNVPITLQCAMDKLMIESDRDKLYEIVDNLIQNAVKFTTEGSIRTGYDLLDDNHVHIWVSDTGKGIAVADQQRIFERFIKLDEYIPGTGLGLSVVKSHVQSLDGKMGVESEIGKGSTFWVDLPLA